MKRLADNNIEDEGFLILSKFQKENIYQYVDDDGDDLTAENLTNENQILVESGPCAICYENPRVMLMLPRQNVGDLRAVLQRA